MKKLNEISRLLLLILLIGLGGCSAEDGADGLQGSQGVQGAEGPQGLQGDQGEQGEQGQNGVDGEDGNTNVIYSDWLDADWNSLDNASSKLMRIPITEISQNELRNKTILYMYTQQWGTSSIYTMPSSGRWTNVLYSFTFGTNSPGFEGILVALATTDGSDLDERQYAAFRGNRFRYVLIPQSSQSGKLDYSNYEAVKAFYNLQD